MRPPWPLALLLCVGCGESLTPLPGPVALVPVNPNPKTKVDLLFMVDNSNSMDAMQQVLRDRFFEFFKPFDELAKNGQYVDFHIGVVTSDYGAGATGAPGCTPSPGGQMGKLQAIGLKAYGNCSKPMGANFIEFSNAPNGPNNLPMGQDLAQTFTCMASVGAEGCGFEHQLESVYAALHDAPPENAGFLRDDAALAVAFLTNEDDASSRPDTDVFSKNRTDRYGYEDSYSRQTRFAIVCCPPGVATCKPEEMVEPPYADSSGPLTNCRANPDPASPQYGAQRYIDFFTRPAAQGGAKKDPMDVLLYAIDAPDEPFRVILGNPGVLLQQEQCPDLNESGQPPCVPVLQHSCQNPVQPVLFGDPAVRLNTVVRSVAQHRIWSICDDDYAGALHKLANLVVSQLGAACLSDDHFSGARPADIQCTAADVVLDIDQQTETPIARCDGATYPCWQVESKPACTDLSSTGAGLTILRNSVPAPANTIVRAACKPLR